MQLFEKSDGNLLQKVTVDAIKYVERQENRRKLSIMTDILKVAAAKGLHSNIQKCKMLHVIRDASYGIK